ncbi:MAG: hypothetical protein F6K36_26560 [Symploca sp. SIO3C6]|nr:hypothetical protein [Symploca sp. SIO3C6]NEO98767.1 hypothetical protein [Symploca sp. SIO2E9]
MKLTVRGQRPYAPNWNKICFQARKATGNWCVNCLNRAELVHHLYYRFLFPWPFNLLLNWLWFLRGKIYGLEVPGYSVVPLCWTCHRLVHRQLNWYKHPLDPDGDRNYPETISYLRKAYWRRVKEVKSGTLPPIL